MVSGQAGPEAGAPLRRVRADGTPLPMTRMMALLSMAGQRLLAADKIFGGFRSTAVWSEHRRRRRHEADILQMLREAGLGFEIAAQHFFHPSRP